MHSYMSADMPQGNVPETEGPPSYNSLETNPASHAAVPSSPPPYIDTYHKGCQPPVEVSQPEATPLIPRTDGRPPSNMNLAIFTCICCNLCWGLPAVIYASRSIAAADRGEFDKAGRHSSTSEQLSITGIVFTVLIAVIVLVFHYATNISI